MTSDSADGRPAFLSTLPAGRGDRRLALAVVLGSGAIFLAAAPFARLPLARVEAFIPIYESVLVILDLITAALLYGQFRFLGSRALCVLASGYLFTALMAVVHMLTFPGLFAPAGLLGAGSQSTAWLYMFWHGAFPFAVTGYALWRRREREADTPRGRTIVGSMVAVLGAVGGFTLLATAGQDALPAIMRDNHYAPAMLAVVSTTWAVSALALIVLWTGRPHTVLDVWLMVVMCVWIFDIALSAVLNAGRFDLGFYAGRIYGLLAATFVLGVLLVENGMLYARLAGAHVTLGRQARALEETVRERTQRLAAIVENSDDAIISKDLDGMITSWNASAERIFGFRAEEAIGQSITLVIPPDRRLEADDMLRRVRRGERLDHFETVRQTRDGRLIDVSLTISPIRDADGTIVGVSKIVRDITERKRADEALRQSEARALALIDSAAEGILIVDEDGRIVAANGQVEAMFGYSERELVGRPMEVLLPEGVRAQHLRHRAEYAADPRVRSMGRGLDLSGRRRDGSEFPVEISLSYVRTSQGLHVMAFITDITERLALERAARQSEKLAALGTLAAGIAHEVNNPLGIIIGRIEVMLLEDEEQGLAPGVREDLGVIHRQAQRVVRLVQSLLSYARPMASSRTAVDVNRAVDEVLLLAERQLTKGGVRLVASLDRSLPPTFGDVSALEQVLLNLVTNARQAIEGAGEICILTRGAPAHPGWIEVVVSDTGPGIPAEIVSRIFDPFFTTKATGTGLGLSITQRIVQEHGGVIEVAPSRGQGTVFVLRFPPADVTGEPAAADRG
jgi:PAS domain S-box-containing protein